MPRYAFRNNGQVVYQPPPGFTWLPFEVRKVAGAPVAYHTGGPYAGAAFDVSHYRLTGGTTYYVGYAGASDSNTGLDTGHSLKTIGKALTMTDVRTIMLYPKFYDRTNGKFTIADQSVNIIGDGGIARICHEDTKDWTLDHADGTYKCVRTSVEMIFDGSILDGNGDYSRLTLDGAYVPGAGLAAGHWYTDGAPGNVYCRAADSRDLSTGAGDANMHLPITGLPSVTGACNCYFENISFEGGSSNIKVQNSTVKIPTAWFKNCTFQNASLADAFQSVGARVFLQNCTAKCAKSDGFNHDPSAAGVPNYAVEINCTSRHNGWGLSGNNNCSTSHAITFICRIGGTYYNASDAYTIGDTGAGTYSWSIGANAYGAVAGMSNFYGNCSGNGGMWLDECISGIGDGADVYAGGRFYYRNCTGFTTITPAAGANIQKYKSLGIGQYANTIGGGA